MNSFTAPHRILVPAQLWGTRAQRIPAAGIAELLLQLEARRRGPMLFGRMAHAFLRAVPIPIGAL